MIRPLPIGIFAQNAFQDFSYLVVEIVNKG